MEIFVIILILLMDQFTKKLAILFLKNKEPIVIIKNFLQLNYVENKGAAFGILQNKQGFLIALTLFILVGILIYIRKNKNLKKITIITLLGIFAGAIGNLIDRIRFNFVVDFIDINFGNLYDFPVFNIADSFLVIFTILLSILVFFDKYENVDKYEDVDKYES